MFRLFGMEPGEVEPDFSTIPPFIHPEDRSQLLMAAAMLKEGKEAITIRYRVIRKDKMIRYFTNRVQLIRNEQDERLIIGVTEDVTNEHLAQEQAKEQSHFIETITQMLPDIVLITTIPSRRLLYFNHQPTAITGFTLEELSQMSYEERLQYLVHPDDRTILDNYYKALETLEDGRAVEMEYRFRKKQGGICWFHVRGMVFKRDAEGRTIEALHFGRDVTRQKEDEGELIRIKDELAHNTANKYEVLFNSIEQGFCIVEVLWNEEGEAVDYRFIEVNEAFERQTKIKNAVGRTIREIEPRHESHWVELVGEVVKTKKEQHIEARAEPLTGGWFEVSAFPANDGNDNHVGVLFNDITERKKAAEHQLALLKHKEEFIGIASHELKTPITSIKMYAELAEESLQTKGDRDNLDLMRRLNTQVDRLSNLVKDLLDTTRMEEGQLLYKHDRFDLYCLIAERAEEMQRIAGKRVIEVKVKGHAPVVADRDRIGQVIVNLLSNAVKYSADGSCIRVTSRLQGNYVLVTVADEGIGIPAQNLPHVFDRFYRVGSSAHSTYPGMGLGLYISAEIIKSHGGTITVTSKQGEGSTFEFSLPVAL